MGSTEAMPTINHLCVCVNVQVYPSTVKLLTDAQLEDLGIDFMGD